MGDYNVTVSKFGFAAESATVTIAEDATATLDFALDQAPSHAVSGTVTSDDGDPIANARVAIAGTPLTTDTDASGAYSFPSVPEGSYQATASFPACYQPQTQSLTVDGDETLDFVLPARSRTTSATGARSSRTGTSRGSRPSR